MDELGDEVSADVERYQRFESPDASAADEHGRRAVAEAVFAAIFGGAGGGGVSGGKRGDLVVVQFDDGRVDSDGGKELLHDVAHAAGGSREDDHGVLRYQPLDLGLH